MPSIPIICMVCGKSVKDSMFPQHMQSVHGGLSQGEAMAADKNIPQSPIRLDKDAPPPPEFMEMAKMLDEKPAPPPVPNKELAKPVSPKTMVEEKRKPLPITLEYHYAGECPECFISLKTIMVHTAGKCFAVAICMNHGQLKEREVDDLEEKTIKEIEEMITNPEKITSTYSEEKFKELVRPNVILKKGGVKRGRRKSKLWGNSTVQAEVRST